MWWRPTLPLWDPVGRFRRAGSAHGGSATRFVALSETELTLPRTPPGAGADEAIEARGGRRSRRVSVVPVPGRGGDDDAPGALLGEEELLKESEAPIGGLAGAKNGRRRRGRCDRRRAAGVCCAALLALLALLAVALGLYYRPPLAPYVCPSGLYDSSNGTCSLLEPRSFQLHANYSGPDFLSNWEFMTFDDPTHGTVNYVSREDAAAANLTYYDAASGLWYLETDTTNRVGAGARGRDSVRIESKERFYQGLFVLDSVHMPTGCGVWPAFWMYGDSWPDNGEIDIMEGVHRTSHNAAALHTGNGCTMAGTPTDSFQGSWNIALSAKSADNCDVNAWGQGPNQGCSLGFPDRTFGGAWNEDGGGVYATLWDDTGIRVWVFKRQCIPEDLRCESPQPHTWGVPMAYFPFGQNCPPETFGELRVVINLTFCGDWAGASWPIAGCLMKGPSCDGYVREQPQAFRDAYWALRHVRVYKQAG